MRPSRYTSEPCSSWMRARCMSGIRPSLRRRSAISSARDETSIPTISRNCRSPSSNASSRPSPQPRSATRVAPEATSAASTPCRRASFRRSGSFDELLHRVSVLCFRLTVLDHESLHRDPREAALVAQVARDDQLLRSGCASSQPSPRRKQLVDLVLARPSSACGCRARGGARRCARACRQPHRPGEPDREVPAVAPLGNRASSSVRRDLDRVAERLEQRADELLAAAAGHGTACSPPAGSALAASSGRSFELPPSQFRRAARSPRS